MSSLLSLIRNENMKIYYRPRTWIMAGLVLVATICFAFLLKSFGTDGFINTLAFASNAASLTFLVFIFSVVIAADIVAGEFTWGTIKLLLIRPVSRSKVLLSKYIAVLLFMLMLLALLFVSSLVLGLLLFGSGGPGSSEDIPLTMSGILREYGFRLIDLVIQVTFAFMISTVFRSSALAISLAFVIMFASNSVMTALIALKKTWAKYILFANTDLSIYFGGRKPPFEGMTLGFSVTMIVLYYALFIVLAWTIFRKRDVAG
ncbi:ABC transporter permease [Paenibacillus ginsengarvi]|uniref:ABC transporter permease n=1 Tax=Paenibacillus ginsengarvi TaxID=400777 RepID=A0A3B0CJT0_9BACL|nr:ABC transporter permease [Paenibacillus ginsengarvi]